MAQHESDDPRVERVQEQERLAGDPLAGVVDVDGEGRGGAADRAGDARSPEGAAHELTPDEVESRALLAARLEQGIFPADRDALVDSARRNDAPGELVGRLSSLPDGTYETVEAVWEALGGRTETRDADAPGGQRGPGGG